MSSSLARLAGRAGRLVVRHRARLALALAVAALALGALALCRRRDGFSIGNIFGKVAQGVGAAVVGGKQVAASATDAWNGKQPGGGGGGGGGGGQPQPQVTYVGRQWDGADWSCRDGTVETGLEDARACLTSQYTNPFWRSDGTKWGWSCPNGTVPTGKPDWNQQCEVGYQARVLIGGKWQCPSGTTDTGANWDNSDWAGAQKQCRRGGAYGQRMWDGAKWACPPGTTDTGRSWGSPVGGGNQCKFVGG